jgi:hypothetical protein
MKEEQPQSPLDRINGLIEKTEDQEKKSLLRKLRKSFVETNLLSENKREGEKTYSGLREELYDDDMNRRVDFGKEANETVDDLVNAIDKALHPNEY